MKMTLDELYKMNYNNYYIMFDNKGNMIEGKGIVPCRVADEVEKVVKNSITKRQKNNYYVRANYFKDKLACVYKITKAQYNKVRGII